MSIDDLLRQAKETAENLANAAGDIAGNATKTAGNALDGAGKLIGGAAENAKSAIQNIAPFKGNDEEEIIEGEFTDEDLAKHNQGMNFPNIESLQQVVNVVNEASDALNDKSKTIRESAIPEVLTGALGAGIGGVGSFAALYGLGSVGLSAAGITSGLAAAGGLVGGGMVAGVFVLAAPIAILGGIGVGTAIHLKNKQLKQEKERLYQEALRKHEAIIEALKDEQNANKERLEYLQSLNILLQRAINDLKSDLDAA